MVSYSNVNNNPAILTFSKSNNGIFLTMYIFTAEKDFSFKLKIIKDMLVFRDSSRSNCFCPLFTDSWIKCGFCSDYSLDDCYDYNNFRFFFFETFFQMDWNGWWGKLSWSCQLSKDDGLKNLKKLKYIQLL